ncbi:hypothetical protein BDV06DRAFT_136916 [Aspergillus oleicola]
MHELWLRRAGKHVYGAFRHRILASDHCSTPLKNLANAASQHVCHLHQNAEAGYVSCSISAAIAGAIYSVGLSFAFHNIALDQNLS